MAFHLLLMVSCCFAISASGLADVSEREKRSDSIPLRLVMGYQQPIIVAWLELDDAGLQSRLEARPTIRTGKAPGDVLVRVDRSTDCSADYRLAVDADGDGRLDPDEWHLLKHDAPTEVSVMRRWSGRAVSLPYSVIYRRLGAEASADEVFFWVPKYRAEGMLELGSCRARIAVLDANGDGLFDASDFRTGTTIAIDRNGDGRDAGRDEWLTGNGIFEFCNSSFEVAALAPDGSSISLSSTPLRIPKLGETPPSLSLDTVDGRTIRLDRLTGRVTVLDFWASWCKPCVAKFPDLRRVADRFGNRLEVILINVDEPKWFPRAHEIMKIYDLRWPLVMSGKGAADPFWRTFGVMEGNHLSVPLYVVIDASGRLRYAGRGGQDLEELEAEIDRVLASESGHH